MCKLKYILCSKPYEKRLTVVVEEILLKTMGARSIHFKYIIGMMDLFPLLDGLWQFHWTPTSSLLCTSH